MRYTLLTALFCLSAFIMHAQSKLNIPLKRELDSMLVLDQKYRNILSLDLEEKGDSLASVYSIKKEDLTDYLWKQQLLIDSLNTIRVIEIIKAHGYPGISLVGEPANEAVFYIIQHSKVIDTYLPFIKEAAEKKELRFSLYAMMLDRSLMFQGKEQLYGTQGTSFYVKNPQTGASERKWIIWPIKDVATVNKRRKDAGFEQTVEDNAKRLGIEYQALTLEEVNRMRGF